MPFTRNSTRTAATAIRRIFFFMLYLRLYQSSYDPDERGTVLSVNHDPAGNAVTYAGYLLLCAGLVGSLTQKGSRFRTLLEKLDRSSQTTDAHEAETL